MGSIGAGKPRAADDTELPRYLRPWSLLLHPHEASLGLALALALLVNNAQGGADDDVAVSAVLSVINRIFSALDLRDETEVAVHTLMLVERLIRLQPSAFSLSTLQSVVLGAVIVSHKFNIDEELRMDDATKNLRQFGFAALTPRDLCWAEASFLQALRFDITVRRRAYAAYVFEMRALVNAHSSG